MSDTDCFVLWDARKIRDYGIGEYIQGVLGELSGLPICALGYKRDRELIGFPMIEVKSRGYTLYEQYEIWAKVKRAKPLIFHTPHYVFPIFYTGRLVVTIHDIIHLIYPHYFRFGAYQYAKLFIKEALRRADAVITVSQRSRADLLSIYPAAKNRIYVIYNGLSEEYFGEVDPEAEESVRKFRPYILGVGNNKPHKRFDLLKRAFAALSRRGFNLVLAGFEGENRGGVFHLGFVERRLLKALYKNAEVLVHPAEYEGFGFPPFEASALGTPVLSTRVGAVDEILGDTVTYFEKNDEKDLLEKLTDIVNNISLYRSKAGRARDVVKKLRWENAARELKEIYSALAPIGGA